MNGEYTNDKHPMYFDSILSGFFDSYAYSNCIEGGLI